MIMPQSRVSLANITPCFDFSGYTTIETDKHLTTENPQLKALMSMIDRVLEPRDSETYDYTAANMNEYGWFDWTWFTFWRIALNLDNLTL